MLQQTRKTPKQIYYVYFRYCYIFVCHSVLSIALANSMYDRLAYNRCTLI